MAAKHVSSEKRAEQKSCCIVVNYPPLKLVFTWVKYINTYTGDKKNDRPKEKNVEKSTIRAAAVINI